MMTNKRVFTFFSFVVLILIMICMGSVRAEKPETLTWVKTEAYGPHERKTVLQFYFHDIISGDSPTVALIARPIGSNNTDRLAFGTLNMADDPLTISPDPNSKLIGRAQGLFGTASQEGVNFIMGLTCGFVDGIYNGSTVVIFGRNSIMNPVREFPVVGGTGLFRMARGYAVAHTYSFNLTSLNAVVGYNVTIFHP
ncbi:dirigent protein 23-like [Amaranthus tricolor]|uniref:dirigent protein 23-like n=1 Tax=Amaranthus tricolor TaxID=29722 RepID=UPI0025907EA6|nr:dirigent protein 23-like [Amaranthus tricolor]